MSKVIISFAIKGAIHTPSMSPHLPVTPEIERGESCGGRSGDRPPLRPQSRCRPLATPDEARDILKLKGGDKVRVLT
jgi:hypothetical protein